MKRAPISYRKSVLTPEQSARFRQIEREFHVRAFGEELTRVNLDFTIQERRQYLAWMRDGLALHTVHQTALDQQKSTLP